jgi:ATP-dependent Clp protease ATP-binding subunit ClpA
MAGTTPKVTPSTGLIQAGISHITCLVQMIVFNESKYLTQAALHAISLAGQEAKRHHHNQVGIGHLLLGLISVDGDLARPVLRDLGLETHHVQELIERASESPTVPPKGARSRMPGSFLYSGRLIRKLISLVTTTWALSTSYLDCSTLQRAVRSSSS